MEDALQSDETNQHHLVASGPKLRFMVRLSSPISLFFVWVPVVPCSRPTRLSLAATVRSQASIPMVALTGEILGSVNIADQMPRPWSDFDMQLLLNLSELVMRDIEHAYAQAVKERDIRQMASKQQQLLMALSAVREGILLCEISALGGWPILFGNAGWNEISGYTKDETESSEFWRLFSEESGMTPEDVLRIAEVEEAFTLRGYVTRSDGELIRCDARFIPSEMHQKNTRAPLVSHKSVLSMPSRQLRASALGGTSFRMRQGSSFPAQPGSVASTTTRGSGLSRAAEVRSRFGSTMADDKVLSDVSICLPLCPVLAKG